MIVPRLPKNTRMVATPVQQSLCRIPADSLSSTLRILRRRRFDREKSSDSIIFFRQGLALPWDCCSRRRRSQAGGLVVGQHPAVNPHVAELAVEVAGRVVLPAVPRPMRKPYKSSR